ncbi:hypothetical protein KY284_026439 [Solanum tuberosum]|nr:hypothetical protein KY284_026439 [Solanum tuberosum]
MALALIYPWKIRVKFKEKGGERDSQFQDLHNSEKQLDSTVPVERTSSSSQGGTVGTSDSARVPVKNLGNLQIEQAMEIQHREGKQHVQDLGQLSTSHMDEQLIKNQSKNTGTPHIDKSHTHVIPASQIPLNAVQKVNANNVRNDRPTGNTPNLPKIDTLVAPAPYTVVHTYADRLRYNQLKYDVSITLTAPENTTKHGLPAVLYVKDEGKCHDPSLGLRRDMANEEPEGTPNKPLKLVITLHRSRKYIQH